MECFNCGCKPCECPVVEYNYSESKTSPDVKDISQAQPEIVHIYLVWNNEKTEGFFTTNKQVAYEARKGSDTNCYYADGTRSDLAIAFCNIHGNKDCGMTEGRTELPN